MFDKPAPLTRFHYKPWIDFANLPNLEIAAEVVVGNGRLSTITRFG